MATRADHIGYSGKASAFMATVDDDIKLNKDSYGRKQEWAAKVYRGLANSHSDRIRLSRAKRLAYASAIRAAIVASAAANFAAAKAMLKARDLFGGMTSATAGRGSEDGMDLDN